MKIGIEQEFVFKDQSGQYLDPENSEYTLFKTIVDDFPLFAGDGAWFECKSLERQPKRCYVEGFEQHDSNGRLVETLPKGLEIRTLPHATIKGVVEEFQNSYSLVMRLAERFGLSPVLTSRHPFKSSLALSTSLSPVESAVRTRQELGVAVPSMFTYGLHVNVSISNYSYSQMEDLVQKVNQYMPSLIPYSFSSPFL